MDKLKVLLILCAFTFCCFSCKNENDSTQVYGVIVNPEFDTNTQSIIYRERLESDIKSDWRAFVNDNSSWELGCFFSFYNYGGDIRLFNGGWEDAFVTVGELSFMHEINENKDILTINERYEDDKYGEWAIAEVMIGSNTFKEVFVSPLAMKEYNEGESSGFIFFQLVGANKCLNAIYYGSNQHCVILSHFFKSIRNGITPYVDGPINGPGRLWQDINNN